MYKEAKVDHRPAEMYSVVTAIFAGFSLLAATAVGLVGESSASVLVVLVATSVSGVAFLGATYAAMTHSEIRASGKGTLDSSLRTTVWHSILYHLGILGLLITLAALGFQANAGTGIATSVASALIALVIVRMALQTNETASGRSAPADTKTATRVLNVGEAIHELRKQ